MTTCAVATQLYEHLYAYHRNINILNTPHSQKLDLEPILSHPGYPKTEQEGIGLLDMVRLWRDHNNYRRAAAECGVRFSRQHLQIVEEIAAIDGRDDNRDHHRDDADVRTSLSKLRIMEQELSSAKEDLAKSRRSVGAIRAMNRREGFRITVPTPPRSLLSGSQYTADDSASDINSILDDPDNDPPCWEDRDP
jgi:hypothetical protein